MLPFRLSHWLTILILSWHSQVYQSTEVCSCPNLRLSLSAVTSDTTKSLQNGFMFVAKKDSTVTLKCELHDKDHPAIQSVVYKFHKTYELSTSKPISLDESKNKEVCSGAADTCDLTNVQYSATSDKSQSLDVAANHIYQCYVEVTLKDGKPPIMLWSHTIKLDVYYEPTKPGSVTKDTKTISSGQALEKLICTIPESNPKTKPVWSFKKDGTDTFEVIDIPNDTRGDRLIIAEDTISLNSQGDIKRGMLLIMIFDPTEDTGDYKCKGVYDTEAFDDIDTSFEISEYAVNSNQQDSGTLQLRAVSEITYPKLVNQDSTVNFTVYARDAPGRAVGNFGDVTYTWQKKGDPDEDVDFDLNKDSLELSNFGRTLTVKDLTKHVGDEYHCKITRNTPTKTEIKSDALGVKTSAVVIAPRYLSIPMSTASTPTCVNFGSNLKAVPNKSYMMDSAELAGDNPKQILLKADSSKFYINAYKVMFITDTADNFDNETAAGVSQEQFAKKLPTFKENRCVYWQYLRGYRLQYQVIEVMKTYRPKKNGLGGFNPKDIDTTKFKPEKKEAERKVVVTIAEDTPIPTIEPLKMALIDSKGVELDSIVLVATAESCENRKFPTIVELKVGSESGMSGLSIKIYSECSPDNALIIPVDPSDGGMPVWAIVIIVLVVLIVVVGVAGFVWKTKFSKGAGDDGSKEEGVVNMKSIEVNHEAEHAYAEAEPEKKE